jgi:hypothetical protein
MRILRRYCKHFIRFGYKYAARKFKYDFWRGLFDRPVYDLLLLEDTFRFLQKKYAADIKNSAPSPEPSKGDSGLNKTIWVCWLQGFDNAPPIVRACNKSVHKHAAGYDVVLLTEKNLHNYVAFPDYILKKYRAGIIPAAHFSDILRTLLLIQYGGVWLDATVLLTDDIPAILLKKELFLFKSSILGNEFLPCASWFIIAREKNPLLTKVYNVLLSYWKHENHLMHYYLYHLVILLIITYDQESGEMWKNLLYKNDSDPHLLQMKLFDVFQLDVKDYIWNLSFSHKLTYYEKDWNNLIKKQNTYYKYIIGSEGVIEDRHD